jgi:cyclophilin family peptidyl-prolyl cis-trans isomerase
MQNENIKPTVVAIVVILVGAFFIFKSLKKEEVVEMPTQKQVQSQEQSPADDSKLSPPTGEVLDQTKKYTVTLKTSEGNIVIEMNQGQTPKTIENFVTLAQKGFYDGTVFHRVIEGFMIQGGDPEGTGRGGPGYRFEDEAFDGEYVRGAIAMANAGPNTNGSQFFILHQNYDLPKSYTIFGTVKEGLEVVDAIATAEVTPNTMGESSVPANPVTVESVEVVAE